MLFTCAIFVHKLYYHGMAFGLDILKVRALVRNSLTRCWHLVRMQYT